MCELGLNHVVDFSRAETDAGGVEDSVRAAEEEDLFGFWMNGDEVAVGPYVFYVDLLVRFFKKIQVISYSREGPVGLEWAN